MNRSNLFLKTILLYACCSIPVSIAVLFLATRPTKKVVLSTGSVAPGSLCALVVQEDRDWRELPFNPFSDKDAHWRYSIYIGRDCDKEPKEGVWTDFTITSADSKSQVSGGFDDRGFTFILKDGRSLFVPASLYTK